MSSPASLFIAAITLLLLQRVQSVPVPTEVNVDPLAADIHSSTGLELKLPSLPYLREPWKEEKRQYHLNRVEPVIEYLLERLDDVIENDVGLMTKIQVGSKLLFMATKIVASQPNADVAPNVGPKFNKDIFALIREILDKGFQVEKSMRDSKEPKNLPKLRYQFGSLLQTIMEGMRASPTAGYVDWRRATLDGVGFGEYCGGIVGSLRYNGFDSVTTIATAMMSLVPEEK